MSAYVILDVEVRDAETYARYRELGPPAVAAYGGRYLVRGGVVESLEGSWLPSRFVILEFPTMEAARTWWASPEYAAAKALRQASTRTEMILEKACRPSRPSCLCCRDLPRRSHREFFTDHDLVVPGAGGPMAKPSFEQQVATLNATLNAIEESLAGGKAAVEGLEDFKSALDDVRLRLWGLLSAAGGDDYKGFQERFRIRRATEMSRGLGGDLRTGAVSGRHRELAGLREAVVELTQSIEQVQRYPL